MLRNANQWRNCCEWGAGSDVKEGAMKCREGSVKEEWGRVRERDPRTARAHVLGMKVVSGCSVVETSRKKYLVGKRRCNFHRFFVPTLQYSSCFDAHPFCWTV